jgi:GT2 family glycosyltransferase
MNTAIFFSNVYGFFAKRFTITKAKTYKDWADRGYLNTPDVSFVIQSHNKSAEVIHLANKLAHYPNSETIVIDDGSNFFHSKHLLKNLKKGNQIILRTNDLYEVVTYNRAIKLAHGKIVVLLQDDDDFESLEWVNKALSLFEKYPKMCILGGRSGLRYYPSPTDSSDFVKCDNVADTKNPVSDFLFVQVINRAPMFIRRDVFIENLKYIDFNYAPFQYDDVELCLRAWTTGWQVGWYSACFKSLSQGGMRIWNKKLTQEQTKKNITKIYDTYGTQLAEINKLVDKANNV